MKRDQAHREFFDPSQINLIDVAHQHSGNGNGSDEQERKIIGGKGEVAKLRVGEPANEKEYACRYQDHVA